MSAKSKSGEPQMIDLNKLNLMQLTQFKNQMDQDLQFYQESIQNLKHAQKRFQESSESVNNVSTDKKEKEILVPLSGSVYVPGQMVDPEKVLIDIGTGYYIEKDVKGAKQYFDKKVKFVTTQIEKIQAMGNEKNQIREAVMDIMESKLKTQFASQNIPAPTKA